MIVSLGLWGFAEGDGRAASDRWLPVLGHEAAEERERSLPGKAWVQVLGWWESQVQTKGTGHPGCWDARVQAAGRSQQR